MRPLLSSRQSLELDEHVRHVFDFSNEMLMEIAAGKLWETLKAEVIADIAKQSQGFNAYSPGAALDVSIAAVCGKGDNAGDALAMLRHAMLEGHARCVAYIPAGEELKESVKKNLERAERCGAAVQFYDADSKEENALASELAHYDVVLDAILGTGTRGPARSSSAYAIGVLNALAELRGSERTRRPRIVSIDVPSGLSDGWQREYPVVCADLTLCIEPMKAAMYAPLARPCAGKILPVGGIFPLWTEKSTSNAYLVEASDIDLFLPDVSPWAYKMQRGRVAILAGSEAGAGAAVHCVRGALAAGAGYVALFCDTELFPSYLAMVGDAAIVRVYSDEDFSPAAWDSIVAGPGWGTDERRSAALKRLLASNTPLLLDADAIRLYARIATDFLRGAADEGKAPVILTPHPGEFRDLLPLIDAVAIDENDRVFDASEPVRQTCQLATRLHAVIALRASTTHIAEPGGSCAIFDGSAFGLGIAGSGDVLAGLAGGFLARRRAHMQETLAKSATKPVFSEEEAFKAIVGAVVTHGIAGARLSAKKGWFTPLELAEECARLTSKADKEADR